MGRIWKAHSIANFPPKCRRATPGNVTPQAGACLGQRHNAQQQGQIPLSFGPCLNIIYSIPILFRVILEITAQGRSSPALCPALEDISHPCCLPDGALRLGFDENPLQAELRGIRSGTILIREAQVPSTSFCLAGLLWIYR